LFDRAIRTADNLSTYRQICAAVARKHGVIASFMPKPLTGVSANGAHHHFTLVDENGTNVFYDVDGPAKLSEIGLQFMGGILDHYRGLCGITAPTVNSYKRFWDFGFWAPIYKDYGWQNRTTLVRVASGGRFEFRAVDSACNPYLTQAALLKCGIAGIIYRDNGGAHAVGHDMTAMLQSMKHRGPDSTGYALYGQVQDAIVMRYTLADANDARDFEFEQRLEHHKREVESRLRAFGARNLEVEKETGYAYRVTFNYDGELKAITDVVEDVPNVEVLSLGHSLEIIKDLGDA